MSKKIQNWTVGACVIAGAAFLGIWLARDAVASRRSGSEGPGTSRPVRPTYQLDRPNPPGKSPADPSRRNLGSPEDLLFSIPKERVVRFKTEDAYRRFLSRLGANNLQLLGRIDRFRAARIGFDDLRDLEGLLGEDEDLQGNFLVSIPEPPEVGAQPGAAPFGGGILEWLGITNDNSTWGEGVRIAILDTGVTPHAAFPDGVREIDLITGDEAIPYHGHGTAVASQIGGQHGATRGIAPSADLLSIRIADHKGASNSFLLAEGIARAVDEGAQLINVSMGSHGDSALVRDAVQYAADNGVLIIAAAGNEGLDQPAYPAALEGVMAVGAVDARGQVLDFSNHGADLDLAAPGFDITAAWLNDGFATVSGTSFSAPIVTGAIAATTSEFGPVPVEHASTMVLEHLNAAGAPGDDPAYGGGIIDVGRVMNSGTSGIHDAAIASNYYVSPSEEDPVGRLLVTVENRGTEPLANTTVDVTVDGSHFPMNVPSLRPGDTHVLTLPVSVPESTESVAIRSALTLGGNIVDDKPSNDIQSGEIILITESALQP